MSDHIEMTPEARWKHLRERGSKVLVDLSSNELISDKPAWLDEARFAKAKAAIEQYYIGIVYSSFTGLLLILQLPDGLEPLLVTGNSKDIPSLYKRYLSTILHVNSWYEDDVFDPNTKGYKSIRQVRSMHRRVQQLMNERHRVRDVHGQEHLWMTQYDVALTQFAFIGLAMLWPKKSALIAAKHEDLELINYYWRVLGYLMGLRDEFNLCQFDNYADIRQLNELVFEHEYKQKFREQACPIGLEMTKGICMALQYFMPLVTFNSLAHWWAEYFSFNGYELQPKTLKDRMLLMWTHFSFNKLLKSQEFLKFSNKLHKKRFDKRLKNRDQVYKQLTERYKECPHLTYYSDRVDYFNKNAGTVQPPVVQANETSNSTEHPNSKNNNNNNEPVVRSKPMPQVANTTTFQGCPMGYDAVLPALRPEQVVSA